MALVDVPRVSVIVLTYNRKEKLRRCLHSLLISEYPQLEITVIDDASTDGTLEMLSAEFPWVTALHHLRPTLTGRSINDGLARSHGEFVVIIDDDNVVASDFIKSIVEPFQQHDDVGVVGPLCYFLEAPGTIMYAGARLSRLMRRVRFLGRGEKDVGQFDTLLDVDLFPNCFAVRMEVLSRTGFVDDWRLPFFNDDASLQLKISSAGYRVVLCPRAKVWHDFPLDDNESRTLSRFRLYYHVRSKIALEFGYDHLLGRIAFVLCLPIYAAGYVSLVLGSDKSGPQKVYLVRVLARALFDGIARKGGTPFVD